MPEATFSAEVLEPDGYLQPRRYRITYQCDLCGHSWSRTTTKLSGRDPPCPNPVCKEARYQADVRREALNMAQIIAEQRAPGHIGDNPVVKQIDTTAQIVMEDHHMTDLKDNVREGDTMAPPLPTVGASGMKMKDVADGFFGGGDAMKRAGMGRQAELLGRQAIAGHFASMAARPAAGPALKGKPPLTWVRSEKLGGG